MTASAALAARLGALRSEGTGDPVGLALVGTLIERAEALPESGRAHLLARAEALLEVYRMRLAGDALEAPRAERDAWRETLEARAPALEPRKPREARPAVALVEEIRATTATAQATEQVPEAAGPYHGAAVAARALEELAALAPGYVSSFVASLEDLASLAQLPGCRTARSVTARKRTPRANPRSR